MSFGAYVAEPKFGNAMMKLEKPRAFEKFRSS